MPTVARLAPLGLVLEVLVGEEQLFTRRPDELRAAVHAVQHLVLEFHRWIPPFLLLQLAPELLAAPLARQRLLGPTLVPRLQVEGMLLDILDDIFLLDLPLEPPKGTLDRFAFLHFDFSHALEHPLTGQAGTTCEPG